MKNQIFFSCESTVEIFWLTRLKLLHRVKLKTEMSRECLLPWLKVKYRVSFSLCLQGKVFVWQTETPKVSRDAWKARFRCANYGQLLNVIYNLTVKQYHVVMKIYVPTRTRTKMLEMNYRCEGIFVTKCKRTMLQFLKRIPNTFDLYRILHSKSIQLFKLRTTISVS